MRRLFLIIVFVLFILMLPGRGAESVEKGLFIDSFLMLPDVTEGWQSFIGAGVGYKLSPRFCIQVGGIYRKYKEKEAGIFNNSLYSVFLDLKYKLNRKRLSPYLLISEGIIVVNKKRILRLSPVHIYESKETDFYFSIGTGAGVRYDLTKKVSLYLEVRGYLILYENDGIRFGGFYPVTGGLSFEL